MNVTVLIALIRKYGEKGGCQVSLTDEDLLLVEGTITEYRDHEARTTHWWVNRPFIDAEVVEDDVPALDP